MKKQRRRISAALLCSSMVLSLVSTPVSAAETGQLTNPPTSTEGPGSPESISGNEAVAVLNGLSVLAANGEAEVTTAQELTAALENNANDTVKLTANITIDTTLTINRTVTLDLNGFLLQMTGSGSVIKVESGGNLTIADSNTSTPHKFTQGGDGLWGLDETGGSKIVYGGIITGGTGMPPGVNYSEGGGVYVSAGAALTMNGGSIVGCKAESGGGVCIVYDYTAQKSSEFIMKGGSIIGCTASSGGGVLIRSGCRFTMNSGSEIRCCTARTGGGVTINASSSLAGSFTLAGGKIHKCKAYVANNFLSHGGGISNEGEFIMESGCIENCTSPSQRDDNKSSGVYNIGKLFILRGGTINGNITNKTTLNADGGEMAGTVTNCNEYGSGTITGSEGAAGSTKFHGEVTNTGTIRKGTFTNAVINESSGTINGGTFTGTVENRGGTISDGDFSGATTLSGTLAITFDPDNGDQSITQEVNWSNDGAALTPPDPTPTKEGYTLDGWYWYYNNNGAETKWNFDTDKARYTMTLKAKWTKNTTPIIPGNNTSNIVEQYKTDDSSSGEQTDREVPSPVVKNATSYMTYTVQTGDTLWKIARKYNCSITGIMVANSDRIKNPNRIHAGWQLKIPQSGAPITGGTPDAVLPENKKSGIYIVRQGDTLWKIARKYNCSVAEIVSLNRELIRAPALIYSGWELKVPQD